MPRCTCVMRVAGIDLSTFAVDLVTVPYDTDGPPQWHRFPLVGHDAFDRSRCVAISMPGPASVLWDEILAVGIEQPNARGPRAANIGALYRVQGAVLAQIPARTLVQPFQPSEWRKAVGLKGNATKQDVAQVVQIDRQNKMNAAVEVWPQDACDAYCIALATRLAITEERAA